VRAKIEKAMIGINQQKKAIMKQRLTSSVSIFFTSPYFIIRIAPRAAIPTTTSDQPTMSHLKKSDKLKPQLPMTNGQLTTNSFNQLLPFDYFFSAEFFRLSLINDH
jgi:hypothetical protein